MDWNKITKNKEVKNLLKQRKEIEEKIKSIDQNALVMYELEVLNITSCVYCESKDINVQEMFCNNCSEYID